MSRIADDFAPTVSRLAPPLLLLLLLCFSCCCNPAAADRIQVSATSSHAGTQEQTHENAGYDSTIDMIRPVEIDHVYGCEGTTTPRHKTFACPVSGGIEITIRGRGFSRGSNTFALEDAKSRQRFACGRPRSSRLLPTLLQFCALPADSLAEGSAYHLLAQTREGKEAILRGAIRVKAAAKAEQEEDNLRKLDFNDWSSLGIGGLGREFEELFRRAFGTRMSSSASIASKLGVKHVKGVILHGPPGTGKTLIARTVAKLLNAKNVQIVSGPEIMSKFVGESEKNLRALFGDAEAEFKKNGGAAGLHVMILDEVDAILRPRGAGDDSAARAVYDGVTTQMLAYMDGFHEQNNLIIIGLTNRLDALDKALLRPGRFEVQIRIPLPDDEGRQQIFTIHTKKMRDHGFLATDVDIPRLSQDTASFSGADIEGVVRSGLSFALQSMSKNGGSEEKFQVTYQDLQRGIAEILATKGSSANTAPYFASGVIAYSERITGILARVALIANTLKRSPHQRLVRFALHGKPETGTTAVAALAARNTRFNFITVITPESLLGLSTAEKISRITQAFETAANVALGCIVLDKVEALIEFSSARGTVNPQILAELTVLLNRNPALVPHQRDSKLLTIVTTASTEVLKMISPAGFDAKESLRPLSIRETSRALAHYNVFATAIEAEEAARVTAAVGIKRLLNIVDVARTRAGIFTPLRAAPSTDLSRDGIHIAPDVILEEHAAKEAALLSLGGFKAVLREYGLLDETSDASAAREPTVGHV